MHSRHQLKLLAVFLTVSFQALAVIPQSDVFTYQGSLFVSGVPANGVYDVSLRAFDSISSGSLTGGPVTNLSILVSNGLFTTPINFGSNIYSSGDVWLEIGVRTNSSDNFITLAPRQLITASPVALYALSAGKSSVLASNLNANQLAGILPLSNLPAILLTNDATGVNLSGIFNGNGYGLTNLNLPPPPKGALVNLIPANARYSTDPQSQDTLGQTAYPLPFSLTNGVTYLVVVDKIGHYLESNEGSQVFPSDPSLFWEFMKVDGNVSQPMYVVDGLGDVTNGQPVSDLRLFAIETNTYFFGQFFGKFTGAVEVRGGITGDGSGLSNIVGANIVGQISPTNIPALIVTGDLTNLGHGGTTNGLSNYFTTSVIGFGTMAFQPTNGPSMFSPTISGQTSLVTNGAPPVIFVVPDQFFIGFGGSNGPATIRYNSVHSVDGELEIKSDGRIALVPGYDQHGLSTIQLGNPNPTHETIYVNSDVNPSGSDVSRTGAGTSQLFGPSKLFLFSSGWMDETNTTHFITTGIRSETLDRQGTTEQRFYNPSVDGNPIGNGKVNGVEQLAVGKGYVRIDGGEFFGVKNLGGTPSTNYFIYWTNTIESIHPTVPNLNLVTTNFIAGGTKKEMVFWGDYIDTALNWPSNWIWLTPVPSVISNRTVGRLTLLCMGKSDSKVLASWASAPYVPEIDTNVSAFIEASGISSAIEKNALVNLVDNLKTNLLWSKFTSFYPLIGGTPDSDRYNLIDPSQFPLVFANSLNYTNGLRGVGFDAVADTRLSTAQFATASECLEFVWIQDTTPPLPNAFFWHDDRNNSLSMNGSKYMWAAGPLGDSDTTTLFPNLPGTNYSGFLGVNVHSGNTQWYTSGARCAISIPATGIVTPNSIKLFGEPSQNVNYTAAGFGAGFSEKDIATLVMILRQFQNDLGR